MLEMSPKKFSSVDQSGASSQFIFAECKSFSRCDAVALSEAIFSVHITRRISSARKMLLVLLFRRDFAR